MHIGRQKDQLSLMLRLILNSLTHQRELFQLGCLGVHFESLHKRLDEKTFYFVVSFQGIFVEYPFHVSEKRGNNFADCEITSSDLALTFRV